jgi:hypothetical protein
MIPGSTMIGEMAAYPGILSEDDGAREAGGTVNLAAG